MAVLAAAVVIATTGFQRADAIASLVVVALIVPRTVRIGRDALHVLLESTPLDVDLAAVRTSTHDLPHVHGVHDLHATQIATGVPVLTAHVVVDDSCFHDGHLMQMLDHVQAEIRESFAIEHTTIQFEAATHSGHEYTTHD